MQKSINTEMSKTNKNINNFFGVDNTSVDYVLASIVTKLDYTIQKQVETDKKITDLNTNIQDLALANTNRSEIINKKIDNVETSINEKIEESDKNTNKKFETIQCEITALKSQDGQKALKILAVIGGIIVAVITTIAVSISQNVIKIGYSPVDFYSASCIIPICLPNTPSSQETL